MMSQSAPVLDPNVIALSLRQPWAELILRGIKTIEVRSQNTTVRGTIYLYAAQKTSPLPIAKTMAQRHALKLSELPTGVLVGTVDVIDSNRSKPNDAAAACVTRGHLPNKFSWHLANPIRFSDPVDVKFLPYGVWFYPFQRRSVQKRKREQ
ncbi:MAG: hypothetical protein Tsb009_36700 [Planctomycetaceae bacterium]